MRFVQDQRACLTPSLLALAKSLTLLALAGTLALALAPLSACGTSSLATLGASTLGRTTYVRAHYRLKEDFNLVCVKRIRNIRRVLV